MSDIKIINNIVYKKYIDGYFRYHVIGFDRIKFNNKIVTILNIINNIPVTCIDNDAFVENNIIETINIPSNIKRIGKYAFYLSSLKTVNFIGESKLEIIDIFAFYLSKLNSINIPDSVISIGYSSFSTESLTNVTINNTSNLETIFEFAFSDSSITTINIPPNVKNIYNNAFSNSKQLVTFTNNSIITSFSNQLFLSSNINTIDIGNDIQMLGPDVFFDSNLSNFNININNSQLELIGSDAFYNSKITNINIPPTVHTIKKYAFSDCRSLTEINFYGGKPFFDSNIFLGIPDEVKNNITIYHNNDEWNDITNIEGIRVVRKESLTHNNSNIKTIFVVDNIRYMLTNNDNYKVIGYNMNANLDNVSILPSIDTINVTEIGDFAFANSNIVNITIPNSITKLGSNAFFNTGRMGNINFLNGSRLKIIDMDCFFNSNIKNISIPDSVTNINNYAFQNSKLSEINITNESSLEHIGYGAFENTLITTIYIPKKVKILNRRTFFGTENLNSINFDNDSELTYISSIFNNISSIKKIILPNNLKELGTFAFNNSYIEDIIVNKKLEKIGYSSLHSLPMTNITLPASVNTINYKAFSNINNKAFSQVLTIYFMGGKPFIDKSFNTKTIGYYLSKYRYSKDWIKPNIENLTTVYLGNIDDTDIEIINNIIYKKYNNEYHVIIYNSYNIINIINIFIENTINGFPVTEISNNVFIGIKMLTCFIPANIKKIGKYAFSSVGCTNIIFGDNSKLEYIDDYAFQSCYNSITNANTTMNIPDSVTYIGNSAFDDFKFNISNISSLKYIGKEAFRRSFITNIIIPSSVEIIDTHVFAECSKLETIEINTETINENLCLNSSIRSVTIGNNVKTICLGAFYNCSYLKTINIDINNSQLELIGPGAFYNCGIETINIPPTVHTILDAAFRNNSLLTEINFYGNKPFFLGSIATDNTKFYCNNKEDWVNTTKIYNNDVIYTQLDSNNSYIKTIIKENNIRYIKIDNKNVRVIGYDNHNINIPNKLIDNSTITEIGKYAFRLLQVKEINIPDTVKILDIGSFSFSLLEKINFTNGSLLEKINQNCFAYSKLINLKLPNTVKYIGMNAFFKCLNTINISNKSLLNHIDYLSFSNSLITKIFIPKHVTKITDYSFIYAQNLQTITFDYNSELKYIGELFYNTPLLKKIILPNNIREIGYGAFSGSSFTNIVLNKKLEKIGKSAFLKMSLLKEITIPASVKIIDNEAFRDCSQLSLVRFLGGKPYIGSNVFKEINTNAVARFSDRLFYNIKNIGNLKFNNKFNNIEGFSNIITNNNLSLIILIIILIIIMILLIKTN
jgi:hypothetical protein